MGTDYVFLTEKEEMWAKMLVQVLKDNGIAYTASPVHGAALVMKTGQQERMRIFVPEEQKQKAEELLHELFSGEHT